MKKLFDTLDELSLLTGFTILICIIVFVYIFTALYLEYKKESDFKKFTGNDKKRKK